MKITDVRTTLLTGPSTNDRFFREARARRSAAFIEVITDGPVGLGETYAGYFCPEAVPAIVDFFRPVLVGQTVDDIPELWRRMYRCGNFWCRVGLGASVLTGIEAALWDLKGKLLSRPVHALLGGSKYARLPAYATGGPANYPKEKLREKVDYYFSLGFRGLKVGAGSFSREKGWYMPKAPREAAEFEGDKLAFMREVAGKDAWLMIDAHQDNNDAGASWTVEVAQAVTDALLPFDLVFLEEPLAYTNPWGYAELCRSSKVPIAGGECLTAAYEWRVFSEQKAFHIGQPDASFIGGLGEFMKVAKMLEDSGCQIATHAWGAGGSLMQNVHAGFAAANTRILEIPPNYGPLHSEIIDGGLVMKDGYVLPPERPGLGIVLTDEIRRRYQFQPGSGEYVSVPGKILPEHQPAAAKA